jgi:hypothetical protein
MPAWGLDMGKTKEELIQYLGETLAFAIMAPTEHTEDMMVSMASAIANGFRMSRKDVNAAKKIALKITKERKTANVH